jgi:hypothetical protein
VGRKFADLRAARSVKVVRVEEPIEDVVARLMGSPDGARVLTWMLETAMTPCPGIADERALSQAEGARKFIAKFNAMAEGSYAGSRPSSDPDAG